MSSTKCRLLGSASVACPRLIPLAWLFPHEPLVRTWWRRQMQTISALLALCAGNSSVTSDFPSHRPVMQSFGVFVDVWTNGWANSLDAGDMRRHSTHYGIIVLGSLLAKVLLATKRIYSMRQKTNPHAGQWHADTDLVLAWAMCFDLALSKKPISQGNAEKRTLELQYTHSDFRQCCFGLTDHRPNSTHWMERLFLTTFFKSFNLVYFASWFLLPALSLCCSYGM